MSAGGEKALLLVVIEEFRQLNALCCLPQLPLLQECVLDRADESHSTWELGGLLVIIVRTSSMAPAKIPSALHWQSNGVKC